MLRKILDRGLKLVHKGRPLHFLAPLVGAIDSFFYEVSERCEHGPFVRDAVDLKRWMFLVIVALSPCIFMAILNSGLGHYVYKDEALLKAYLLASHSVSGYLEFVFFSGHFFPIITAGLKIFLPMLMISYMVGGFWEVLFAMWRREPVAEGFFVTGMLYPLVLPPTLPYWILAFGVSVGIIISKELFGGTGMNILNPAMTCRTFVFLSFPSRMSGDVWIATSKQYDGISQATPLSIYNVSDEIKQIHVEAIRKADYGLVGSPELETAWQQWFSKGASSVESFVTAAYQEGGLALSTEHYSALLDFVRLEQGVGHLNIWQFFIGNQGGCTGETSTLACLIGGIILIFLRLASWRSISGVLIGAFLTASAFEYLSVFWGPMLSAKYALPSYKHLLLGGFAFGTAFMVTDPVSSPAMKEGQWIYGFLIGFSVIIIRILNPAYPEGMMFAVLLGNVFAPLIDHYSVLWHIKRRRRVFK